MDRAALNGPGPHNGDLHDDVFEAGRLEAGQHLLLGAAFHLEGADSVGLLQHAIERRIVQGQHVQVRRLFPVGCDVLQGLADHAQCTQGQQVQLDQPGVFDAVLVPLGDHAARHGRRFQWHNLV